MIEKISEISAPLLALDVGTKRIGVAYLARGLNVPIPLEVIPRAQGRGERIILELLAQREVKNLLVGMPLGVDGAMTPQCQDVLRFCRRLVRRAPQLSFLFIDEYLSSHETEQKFSIRGKSARTRGESVAIDSLVATLFLEEYLRNPAAAFMLELDSGTEA